MWQGPQGTPHGDDRPPAEEVWTGVDFSVCVVAPPGWRGGSQWEGVFRRVVQQVDEGSQVEERAEGDGVSVEGPGRLFVHDGPRASVAYIAARMCSTGKG